MSRYGKSFAECEKSQYWDFDRNNGKSPDEFSLYSHKKAWFLCPKCAQFYHGYLSKVANGRFCPCPTLRKTFAECEKSQYWDFDKNNEKKT